MDMGFSWVMRQNVTSKDCHKHRDCKIWPCGAKFILFYCSYLAHKCTSFYIKITAYYLPFKFESQNEDRWSNFAKIFIFVLSNGVFPMLLTENTTNDTCQSNLRGAWNDVRGDTKIEVIEREFPSVYILSVTRIAKLTSLHAIKNNINYSKKKFNIQQPVPSRRFQYKAIGKMQFEMRKMVFLRKRRFYLIIWTGFFKNNNQ